MPTPPRMRRKPRVAFVLGGGGHMGAVEVGMLRALLERDVRPDLAVGTSVGALNGAAVAADPSLAMVDNLEHVWLGLEQQGLFGSSMFSGAVNLVRSHTHLHPNGPLRRLIERLLPVSTFEELLIPFQCVAANIERASEHWFDSGPLADAILASSALPGVLPPVEIGGEHFVDGGIVNSIPIGRAVTLGATELYILHVGRVDQPLRPPRNLVQVAMVSFEIARRHRFFHDMAALPPGVTAHVLPTGEPWTTRYDSLSQLRYRDLRAAAKRIERAHGAAAGYLDRVTQQGDRRGERRSRSRGTPTAEG